MEFVVGEFDDSSDVDDRELLEQPRQETNPSQSDSRIGFDAGMVMSRRQSAIVSSVVGELDTDTTSNTAARPLPSREEALQPISWIISSRKVQQQRLLEHITEIITRLVVAANIPGRGSRCSHQGNMRMVPKKTARIDARIWHVRSVYSCQSISESRWTDTI